MNTTLPRFFWREFRTRRKKAALITFSLFWGTLSILLLLASGQGMSNQFKISFSGLGDTLLLINGAQTSLPFQGLPKGRQIRLYPEDIAYLRERIPEIRRIVPESYSGWQVSANGREVNRTVHGTVADFGEMRAQIPQEGGRFLDPDDELRGRKVAFLGWKVARDLFGDEAAIGKTVVINRVPFTVVGVLKKKLQDSTYQGPDADQVYLPFSAFSQIDTQRYLDMLHIQPRSIEVTPLVEERVRILLGRKYRFDPADRYALNVWNTIENARDASAIFKGIQIFLGLMGGLTLLIGAVGVTNLLYATVKQRTREIGIKLAIGARRRVIVQQFLLETVFIFSKGTFWGFVTAFNLISLANLVPINYENFGIESYLLRPVFSFRILLAYLAILGALVFFSGIFPALRASRLNPIESLRYE